MDGISGYLLRSTDSGMPARIRWPQTGLAVVSQLGSSGHRGRPVHCARLRGRSGRRLPGRVKQMLIVFGMGGQELAER